MTFPVEFLSAIKSLLGDYWRKYNRSKTIMEENSIVFVARFPLLLPKIENSTKGSALIFLFP